MKDLKPLRWDVEKTVAENTREQLPAALAHYLAFGDELVSGDVHPRELHRLRLATKHIRYSVEVFEGLFGPRIQELLKILRDTQQRLGAISDATATSGWLKKQALSREPEAIRLMEFLEARAEEGSHDFGRFWKKHFGDAAQRERWIAYLIRYAGRRAGSPSRRKPGRADAEVKTMAEAVPGTNFEGTDGQQSGPTVTETPPPIDV